MAAKDNIARFRNLTLTQGGADAFVQATEYTGIDPSTGMGWMLERMEIEFPQAAGLQGISADCAVHLALTRESKTAMSDINDSDTLAVMGFFNALTTSGQLLIPQTMIYTFPPGVVVVEPYIFAHLDSAATGLTLTAYVRLFYSDVKLSEVEMLRMLTQG